MGGLLIVGASLAGLRAAASARAAGYEGELTIVGAEPEPPYDRPPLSKQLLWGEFSGDDCTLAGADFEAEWRLGVPATRLDPAARQVHLADGETLDYERLILATGASARRWPGTGADLDGVHTLRTLADAVALRDGLAATGRIAIVGAGFIGCEVAASARRLGHEVVLIDAAERPLLPLGELLGEHCATLQRRGGVDLRLGAGVEALLGEGSVTGVELTDGTVVEAELVLVALGSRPNVEWLADSGLGLEAGGIHCDHQLAARGAADIWCAGDICAFPHPLSARPAIRIEHWTNAAEQGALAGRNAVAEPRDRAPLASLPSFWSDQYDGRYQAVGFPAEAEGFRLVERSEDGERLVAIGERDGRLIAAVGFGAARRMPWYRRRITERTALPEALAELAEDPKTLGPVGEEALR